MTRNDFTQFAANVLRGLGVPPHADQVDTRHPAMGGQACPSEFAIPLFFLAADPSDKAMPQSSTADSDAAARSREGKLKVLVVEDDAPSRRALAALLAHVGWEVASAATVAEAMQKMADPPDWVVLDLMLPDGDGAAVLQYIRASNLPTRVTVTTGVSDPARLAKLAELRPQHVLRKPFDLADLLKHA